MSSANERDHAALPLVATDGTQIGLLRLAAIKAEIAGVPTILVPESEALDPGEPSVQLLEQASYEFEVDGMPPGTQLTTSYGVPGAILSHFALDARVCRGTLATGSKTGTLGITATAPGGTRAMCRLEVRSSKADYRRDYRRMLAQISTEATELLLSIRSPAGHRFSPGSTLGNLHTQMAFLRALLGGPSDFHAAIRLILQRPYTVLERDTEVRSVSRSTKASSHSVHQLSSRRPRVAIPTNHPLFRLMSRGGVASPTLPQHVERHIQTPTLDTVENRFVAFVLRSLSETLDSILQALRNRPELQREQEEILAIRESLDCYARNSWLADLPQLSRVPLSSTVLQQRSGYRQVLEAWTKFQAGARLNWDGGRDVYWAGTRDVAQLYEYWLFFRFLSLAESIFVPHKPIAYRLFQESSGRFDLRLKRGLEMKLPVGRVRSRSDLAGRLLYNASWPSQPPPSKSGSWTIGARPDYTFAFWPGHLTYRKAIDWGEVSLVHFDAKYRLQPDRDFGIQGRDFLSGTARRADLEKMHTYRDSIRQSIASYVVYPGSKTLLWSESDRTFPSIGALPFRPLPNNLGTSDGARIEALLLDIVGSIT